MLDEAEVQEWGRFIDVLAKNCGRETLAAYFNMLFASKRALQINKREVDEAILRNPETWQDDVSEMGDEFPDCEIPKGSEGLHYNWVIPPCYRFGTYAAGREREFLIFKIHGASEAFYCVRARDRMKNPVIYYAENVSVSEVLLLAATVQGRVNEGVRIQDPPQGFVLVVMDRKGEAVPRSDLKGEGRRESENAECQEGPLD